MNSCNDPDSWLSEISLDSVTAIMRNAGASEILYKILPQNANSKNQVYLGGKDPSQFAKIPSGEMTVHESTSTKRGGNFAIFQASLEFYWLDKYGNPHRAPAAKLIYYPQYPEVRFSGFLQGCKHAPSSLWSKERRGTEPGRILLMGIGDERRIYALTLPPESPAAKEIRTGEPRESYGVFGLISLAEGHEDDDQVALLKELCAIHHRQWVPATRLDRNGLLVPCNSSNCNGNTLESLLGIRSNGYSLPDYRGWEIKARQVPNADNPTASVVTLFTPEPTGGIYASHGAADFVRRYGYPDRKIDDRLNFGGIYRVHGVAHARTGLRLRLNGYNSHSGYYTSAGSVQLVDHRENIAAEWPFQKLMDHWKIKHARAAFVPSQARKVESLQYRYGRKILLGEGANFGLFLSAIEKGLVYYDPGIKLENVSSAKPKLKARSQFRVASKNLAALYESTRIADACDPPKHFGRK